MDIVDRSPDRWARPDGELGRYIKKESQRSLDAYRAQPNLVDEHANEELDQAHGGYQHRQLFELVQNSADALLFDPGERDVGDHVPRPGRGHIEVRLTERFLYCADDGEPIDPDGVKALMFSRLSPKRGTNQIGTFGLGFKAVLGVSDAPEFFSRSGSFRFDSSRSEELIKTFVPNVERYPVLRLPEAIDPVNCRKQDGVLRELMEWAVNIVRLPLRGGAPDDLRRQMAAFPAEFLLFVAHVGSVTMFDDSGVVNRVMELEKVDDSYLLAEGNETTEWRLFERTQPLSSDARTDQRPGDDRHEVPLSWAAPVDRLNRDGKFWAFFPTDTTSLVPGVLNAPWKTNEGRQSLLPGPYNDYLISSFAALMAEKLPLIRTAEDPARHLDVLPPGSRAGDSSQARLLRKRLFAVLHGRSIVPDQSGQLRRVKDISYPPAELTPDRGIVMAMDRRVAMAPFERWEAYPGRPDDWLHHKALTRNRLATIGRLFQAPDQSAWRVPPVPRASLATWLEALLTGATPAEEVAASVAAVQTAALIPGPIRTGANLGRIVLTESGGWRRPDALFLPFESPVAGVSVDPDLVVNSALVTDKVTLAALRKLGLKPLAPPSPRDRFERVAGKLLAWGGSFQRPGAYRPADPELLEEFWKASRALDQGDGQSIIREHSNWRRALCVRTRADAWKPLCAVLMPGAIVPGDGSRDDAVTVDCDFHEADLELLTALGVTDRPSVGYDPRWELMFTTYQNHQEKEYRRRSDLPATPHHGYVAFTEGYSKVGPLSVLDGLSGKGAAAYTNALLGLDACYQPWVMWHTGTKRETYPKMPCESLPIHILRSLGRVQTSAGIVPLADALGQHPASPAALHALLQHPSANKIKTAFDLSDPVPDLFGEGDRTPLTDIWPGLWEHLPAHRRNAQLVPCERIRVAGAERHYVFHGSDVYLVGNVDDDERSALEHVSKALDLGLKPPQIEAILQRRTRAEIEERRAAVRQYATDAERLLKAVGEQNLRSRLPPSLLNVLERGKELLPATEIAEAAIATYDADALRTFKWALDPLGPPTRWAGSSNAVAFVRSLGFSEEWAGERKRRRPPFMELEGPWSLPELHDYQTTVATNVREMLRSNTYDADRRRGMVSLPTGSGKTRVAVQAIVEAMRDDGFRGGVLWVADRDELCEQAVEAWAQVWKSEGIEAGHLRISRMWSGQPRPLPTNEDHVVVATIQTLNSRLSNRPTEYGFLKNFKLLVFDEAHRSTSPTSTSVMRELGLTYRSNEDEPFLIGLTATPYRGYDEAETERLVRRYGSRRLDSGAFADDDPQEVIQELQGRGVLAQVDQLEIEGETFRLTPEEWEEIRRFVPGARQLQRLLAWLPQSVEDRIAYSAQRTRRILDAYKDHIGQDWPTLIFAASVEHAQTLAALLNRDGIAARAVSGQTERATRRRVVEAFRNGEIKALVNYAVFREGFDAPKTRAIIVARPVYSPNLYFQMIGRGLRGPLNGGDERCLILNVRDNIEGFGQAVAFSDLDWLWHQ